MRETCFRCFRPKSLCVCDGLAPAASRSRVVLLQHPREARVAICTATLTRLALANAELHRGVRFDADARIRALAATPGAALLFPSEGATPAGSLAGAPPPVLFAVDATWHHAERMVRDSPLLSALPRVAVQPGRPSGYGALRREPADGHLSTLEAVALALGALEGDPARFEPMVGAFRRMVELQLARAREDRRPRHRPSRRGAARA